ncbi:MAG: NFACT family protein [Bacilli bacterium]|nr:NFACT family protein [Bacilli bacterium]MDY6430874.1 NFACT family protein [Bacilli bacterium]
MKISNKLIEKLSLDLNEKLAGKRINKVVIYTKDIFIFYINKSDELIVNLEQNRPYVYLNSTSFEANNTPSNLQLQFRKEFSNSTILKVEQINEDRILKIKIESTNEIFKKEIKYIIVELITNRANFLILNEQDNIYFVLRPTPLTYSRPLFKGMNYTLPSKTVNSAQIEEDSLEDYYEFCKANEQKILNRRKDDKYKQIKSFLTRKIKSLKKKINSIENEKEQSKKELNYNEIGDFIYTNYDELLNKSFFIYEDRKIEIPKDKSLSNFANDFYKKSKKAKKCIEESSIQTEKAKEDLIEYETLLCLLSVSSEAALDRFIAENHLNNLNSKKKIQISPALPYEVIINDVVYRFGKTSSQNDLLTFGIETNPNYLFFHLKDRPSSHLILKKVSPSNKEIETACQIILILSDLSSGEIEYTLHKNIRKGQVPGQVILGSYNSAYLNKIDSELRQIVKNARKIRLKN